LPVAALGPFPMAQGRPRRPVHASQTRPKRPWAACSQ
jgi:hypothetical protein